MWFRSVISAVVLVLSLSLLSCKDESAPKSEEEPTPSASEPSEQPPDEPVPVPVAAPEPVDQGTADQETVAPKTTDTDKETVVPELSSNAWYEPTTKDFCFKDKETTFTACRPISLNCVLETEGKDEVYRCQSSVEFRADPDSGKFLLVRQFLNKALIPSFGPPTTLLPAPPTMPPQPWPSPQPRPPPPPNAVCGNGICEYGEFTPICPPPPPCLEQPCLMVIPPCHHTCEVDCRVKPPVPAPVCGNGICEIGEATPICPHCPDTTRPCPMSPCLAACEADCRVAPPPPPPPPPNAVCGNGICEYGEFTPICPPPLPCLDPRQPCLMVIPPCHHTCEVDCRVIPPPPPDRQPKLNPNIWYEQTSGQLCFRDSELATEPATCTTYSATCSLNTGFSHTSYRCTRQEGDCEFDVIFIEDPTKTKFLLCEDCGGPLSCHREESSADMSPFLLNATFCPAPDNTFNSGISDCLVFGALMSEGIIPFTWNENYTNCSAKPMDFSSVELKCDTLGPLVTRLVINGDQVNLRLENIQITDEGDTNQIFSYTRQTGN